MGKRKKTINFITVFFISHKSGVKTFLKQIVNNCPKGIHQHDPIYNFQFSNCCVCLLLPLFIFIFYGCYFLALYPFETQCRNIHNKSDKITQMLFQHFRLLKKKKLCYIKICYIYIFLTFTYSELLYKSSLQQLFFFFTKGSFVLLV